MTTLREMRDTLLSMDAPGKMLDLADKYLTDMELKGEDFHLPSVPRIHRADSVPLLQGFTGLEEVRQGCS